MMVNSELKVVFDTSTSAVKKTLYIQLTETDGRLRQWNTTTNINAAKWRWNEGEMWRGPCYHANQLEGYWFFFKTTFPEQKCQAGNFENSVNNDGFYNSDDSNFFPSTGWDPRIKLYARTSSPWKHVMNVGCKEVLTEGTYGASKFDACWKGYTDDAINKMMVGSELLFVFGSRQYFGHNYDSSNDAYYATRSKINVQLTDFPISQPEAEFSCLNVR